MKVLSGMKLHSARTSSASWANAVTPVRVRVPMGSLVRLVNGTMSVILVTFHFSVATSSHVTLPLKVCERLYEKSS